MSHYPAKLTRCRGCGKRLGSPLLLEEHAAQCLVYRSPAGYVRMKVGTHGTAGVKTRNILEVGKRIRITYFDGTKLWVKVNRITNDCVFADPD